MESSTARASAGARPVPSGSAGSRPDWLPGPPELSRDWTNITFVAAAHLAALAAIAWLVLVRTSPWTIGLGVAWYALCGLAITGGYHRHFAHSTYRAGRAVRAFYLVLGAAAVQNSALKWSGHHRVHHARTDRDEDPYDIRRGFWWAHIGWILHKDARPGPLRFVEDLAADPLVRWQDRHYVLLAILCGVVAPALLGLAWGDPIGAVLVAGFLRLVVQWHATGAVNSFAHSFGRRPYTLSASARDSAWTALLTLGEGYHNFHHRFQRDYRNGVRWWQFDPTKWFVWSLWRVGLARDLRRTSRASIQRARDQVRSTVRALERVGPGLGGAR